ncbi:hypothetical protein ACH4UT_32030 [Streptomyces sp. NPDC020799]|uniref:hypothetical protein n=1 Tax=Streptomyces sp. NPDC020799 TaxID=3365091 RepID=UPI00378CD58C
MHTIALKTPLDEAGLPHRPARDALPAALADTFRYHHPHFLGTSPGEREGWVVYAFAPFTGLEPQPEFPQDAYEVEALTWELSEPLHRQYTAALVLWSHARLRHQAKPLLHKAASLWSAWVTARDELVSVFEEFWTTSDGRWRAQILRLTDVERAANKAADDWDTVAAKLAQAAADQTDVAGYNAKLPLTTVARELGLDTTDWIVHHIDDYTKPLPQFRVVCNGDERWDRATPLVGSATQLIEAQRERLREVADLAGDSGPAHQSLA